MSDDYYDSEEHLRRMLAEEGRLSLAAELAVLTVVGAAVTAGIGAAMGLRAVGMVLEASRAAVRRGSRAVRRD